MIDGVHLAQHVPPRVEDHCQETECHLVGDHLFLAVDPMQQEAEVQYQV